MKSNEVKDKAVDFIEEKEIDKKIDSAKDKVGEISTSIRDKMIVDREEKPTKKKKTTSKTVKKSTKKSTSTTKKGDDK